MRTFLTSIILPLVQKYSKKFQHKTETTIFTLTDVTKTVNDILILTVAHSTSPQLDLQRLKKLLTELMQKRSTGPFGIPVFLLKKFKIFFSQWLAELVNLSFETGIFPDVLKVAKVNLLHKKESKIDHRNYGDGFYPMPVHTFLIIYTL